MVIFVVSSTSAPKGTAEAQALFLGPFLLLSPISFVPLPKAGLTYTQLAIEESVAHGARDRRAVVIFAETAFQRMSKILFVIASNEAIVEHVAIGAPRSAVGVMLHALLQSLLLVRAMQLYLLPLQGHHVVAEATGECADDWRVCGLGRRGSHGGLEQLQMRADKPHVHFSVRSARHATGVLRAIGALQVRVPALRTAEICVAHDFATHASLAAFDWATTTTHQAWHRRSNGGIDDSRATAAERARRTHLHIDWLLALNCVLKDLWLHNLNCLDRMPTLPMPSEPPMPMPLMHKLPMQPTKAIECSIVWMKFIAMYIVLMPLMHRMTMQPTRTVEYRIMWMKFMAMYLMLMPLMYILPMQPKWLKFSAMNIMLAPARSLGEGVSDLLGSLWQGINASTTGRITSTTRNRTATSAWPPPTSLLKTGNHVPVLS